MDTRTELIIQNTKDSCWYAHEGNTEFAEFFLNQAILLARGDFQLLDVIYVIAISESIRYFKS